MKQLLFLLTITSMGCSFEQSHTPPTTAKEQKQLVVQIIDYSKSIRLNHFDDKAARELYYSISRTGGCLKVIGIYENSSLQDLFTLEIPKLDTENTAGIKNLYNLGHIKAANQKKITAFNDRAEKDIAEYKMHTELPCASDYSDISGALSLAQTTLSEPCYRTAYRKTILICSDMINDQRGQKSDKFSAFEIDDTQVLCIRPSLSLDSLQSIFPNCSVYSFTTPINSINFLNDPN